MRGGIHDRGVHGRGHLWQGMCMAGGVHGRGCACMVGVGGHGTESCMVGACMTWEVGVQGKRVCVVGGMYGRGVWMEGCAWWGTCVQERQPLQRTVRILLECILVFDYLCIEGPSTKSSNSDNFHKISQVCYYR